MELGNSRCNAIEMRETPKLEPVATTLFVCKHKREPEGNVRGNSKNAMGLDNPQLNSFVRKGAMHRDWVFAGFGLFIIVNESGLKVQSTPHSKGVGRVSATNQPIVFCIYTYCILIFRIK